MEIDFLEAEFIKQVLSQQVEGWKVFDKSGEFENNIAAVSGFLGYEVSEEKARDIRNIMREQMVIAKIIIGRINNEFGLNG